MRVLAQLTPFTCVLACWSSFLEEQGLHVTQADLLLHHRDLYLDSLREAPHDFGRLELHQFVALARRYCFVAHPIMPGSVEELVAVFADVAAVFLGADDFNGTHLPHFARVIDVRHGMLDLLVPDLLFGSRREVEFEEVRRWSPKFVSVQRWAPHLRARP
jgi:hypothetical protein